MISNKIHIILCFLLLAVESYAFNYQFNITPSPAEITFYKSEYRYENSPELKFITLPEGRMPSESYRIKVDRKGITVTSSDPAGKFYAQITLNQLLHDAEELKSLPYCEIYDYPRFPYRGLHFDVSRHFRSIDFLKKQIDAMATYKMNRMHIHLTDAAGWRIQIDSYPRLTQLAAWRPQHTWKEWWSNGRFYAEEGAAERYGGYYTKDELRDLVGYAAQKHIEIIPEIEMPSHSEEVLAAYPELGCSGQPYKDSDFCVGNEEVFRFLETVLEEVMDIFPSEFIHIGGDEAGKQHWKDCPKCQKRMHDKGMTSVDELQSYMICRIERFVNSKGRRIIGWDEILQGGLAPGATVMSWRGTEGGIKAMEMGHDVVMSPGRYCYLDHAQDAPFKEPESIGGYLPLDSVYVYEPVEPSMPADKLHHLLGVQANLWSEYVVTDSHAEYMYWPRAIAVAETGWSQPQNKNLEDFRRRALAQLEFLKAKGYTVFNLAEEYGERKLAQSGIEHKAKGKKVTYNKPIQEWYPAAGETTFTDGVIGGWTYSDKRWQGFLSDIDVIIDLEKITKVSYIGGTFMQLKAPGVFVPQKVDILVSEDGIEFTLVETVWNDIPVTASELLFKTFHTVCDKDIRYVRYHAYRSTMRGFLFLDEIVVN